MIALVDGDILTYRLGFASERTTEGIVRARVDEFMTNLLLYHTDADDFEGFLTLDSDENYRHAIAVTAPYKGNRPGDKPKYYDFIRDYLIRDWGFQWVRNQEADDALGIAAFTKWEKGDKDYVICTIDKDLDMIPGPHYNFVKKHHFDVDEREGMLSFYCQILSGDRVDNIIGIRGIGPAKARARLIDCGTEVELFEQCVKEYEGNVERVVENGKLL